MVLDDSTRMHDHAYMVIVYYFKLEVSRRRANTMGKKKQQIQVKDAVVVGVVVGSFGPIEPAARYATLIPHTHKHAYALTHIHMYTHTYELACT